MNITVKLFATLKQYSPGGPSCGESQLVVAEHATAASVLDRLGITADIPKIILINNAQMAPDAELTAGDTLCVFPPIAGG